MEQELFISEPHRTLSTVLNMDDYMGSQCSVCSTSFSSAPPSGPLVFPSGSRGTLHSPLSSIRIDATPHPLSFKMGEPFHSVTTGFQCSVVHVASGPKRCSSAAIPASTLDRGLMSAMYARTLSGASLGEQQRSQRRLMVPPSSVCVRQVPVEIGMETLTSMRFCLSARDVLAGEGDGWPADACSTQLCESRPPESDRTA